MRISFLFYCLIYFAFISPIFSQPAKKISVEQTLIQTLIDSSWNNRKNRPLADSLARSAYAKAIGSDDFQGQADAIDLMTDLFDAYDDLDSSLLYYEKGLALAIAIKDKKTEAAFYYGKCHIQL